MSLHLLFLSILHWILIKFIYFNPLFRLFRSQDLTFTSPFHLIYFQDQLFFINLFFEHFALLLIDFVHIYIFLLAMYPQTLLFLEVPFLLIFLITLHFQSNFTFILFSIHNLISLIVKYWNYSYFIRIITQFLFFPVFLCQLLLVIVTSNTKILTLYYSNFVITNLFIN